MSSDTISYKILKCVCLDNLRSWCLYWFDHDIKGMSSSDIISILDSKGVTCIRVDDVEGYSVIIYAKNTSKLNTPTVLRKAKGVINTSDIAKIMLYTLNADYTICGDIVFNTCKVEQSEEFVEVDIATHHVPFGVTYSKKLGRGVDPDNKWDILLVDKIQHTLVSIVGLTTHESISMTSKILATATVLYFSHETMIERENSSMDRVDMTYYPTEMIILPNFLVVVSKGVSYVARDEIRNTITDCQIDVYGIANAVKFLEDRKDFLELLSTCYII